MDAVVTIAEDIKSKIFTIRGFQVMLDRDLAELYEVETKILNRAVKRNIERFPDNYMFQLTKYEYDSLRFQIGTSNQNRGGNRYLPHAFTEQGVAMISAVLHSSTAVNISIQIINAFIAMRKFLIENASIFQRLDRIELKQLESDHKFDIIFDAIESKKLTLNQGIFFDGQIFDAYKFVSDLIRKAKKSITLIDNFVDEITISILTKKNKDVKVLILTQLKSKIQVIDIMKANEQYKNFEIREFNKSHDRFLIIDNTEIYHIGASLKDLGKKWFGFSKMEIPVLEMLEKI